MGRISLNMDAIGMKEVLRQLDGVGNLPRTTTRALTAGANIVLQEAKTLAPVRTGKMKKALKVGRRKKTLDRFEIEVGAFHGDAPHAHLVEHGHGGPKAAGAHPFLAPAAENTEEAAVNAIVEELKGGI